MSWRAQNRSKDAKTPSGSRGRSDKPELDLRPVQPYLPAATLHPMSTHSSNHTLLYFVLIVIFVTGVVACIYH